jgi:hypothetical protein
LVRLSAVGSVPVIPRSLSSDLRERGVPDSAFVILGKQPSVLRLLPAFWEIGSRVVWVSGGRAVLAVATMNHRRLGRVVATAETGELEVGTRLGERQLMIGFPGGERVVVDGRAEVRRVASVLGDGRRGG